MRIILEETEHRPGRKTVQFIDSEDLLKKVKDVITNGSIPVQFENMTYLAFLKADLEDKCGFKRFHEKMREQGVDI